MEQHLSGSRFSISTAACVPAEMLCVLRVSSCSTKYLYLLPESRCSMCSSRAALCAPGKLLLHNALLEHLYLLLESRCSTCSSRPAVCAPGKPLRHVLQWSSCICSQRAAAPRAVFQGSHCSMCSSGAPVSANREQLLHVLQQSCSPREQLLHVVQQRCSVCSWEAAAP